MNQARLQQELNELLEKHQLQMKNEFTDALGEVRHQAIEIQEIAQWTWISIKADLRPDDYCPWSDSSFSDYTHKGFELHWIGLQKDLPDNPNMKDLQTWAQYTSPQYNYVDSQYNYIEQCTHTGAFVLELTESGLVSIAKANKGTFESKDRKSKITVEMMQLEP